MSKTDADRSTLSLGSQKRHKKRRIPSISQAQKNRANSHA